MTRVHRQDQAELEREFARQQAERPGIDTTEDTHNLADPDYCPQARDHWHTWRKNVNDPAGLRRCVSCGACKGSDGVVLR